jgi:recombination protein RecA
MFGNPETTTGGRSLKFYASIRMEIRKTQTITDKGEVTGNKAIVKVVKNKVAPPFRNAEFDIMYGQGISKEGSLIDMAEKFGIIEISGAWFKYKGQNFAQGRENAKNYMIENPKIKEEIEKQIYKSMEEKADLKAIEAEKKPMKATADIDLDKLGE